MPDRTTLSLDDATTERLITLAHLIKDQTETLDVITLARLGRDIAEIIVDAESSR